MSLKKKTEIKAVLERSSMNYSEGLDIDPRSFGPIGVFAIFEMGRFYRYVLIAKHFPHHAAMAFKHAGQIFTNTLRILDIGDISTNLSKVIYHHDEHGFALRNVK